MKKKFLRKFWNRYSKLGKGRKKKQKWRRARGRHNKIRECKKGNPSKVKIGYKKPSKEKILLIHNIKELEKTKNKEVIIAKIGAKKKKEILKRAGDIGVKVLNLKIKDKSQELEKSKEIKQDKNNKK